MVSQPNTSIASHAPVPHSGKSVLSRLSERQIAALVCAAAALVFLPFLGATHMFDPTDSFFIESAREMLQVQQFAVPLMNYVPWLDKPAFDFWLIVFCFKLFGINEFAGRLPSAVSGILTVVSVYLLSRKLLSRRQAVLAAAILLSTPLFVVVGHVSLTDEPLSLFLTITLLSLAIASIERKAKYLIPAYLALSLAVLCKGPLALVLVGLITLAYFVVKDFRRVFLSIWQVHPLAGSAAVLLLTAPYYVWAHQATQGAFTQAFFFRQYIGRMVGVLNHVRPFWWYAPVVLAGFFPWSLLNLFAGPFLAKIWRGRSLVGTKRRQLLLFACCWMLIAYLLFSAIPTKLETYIVPLAPAFAIFTGCFLDLLIRAKQMVPIRLVAGAVILALLIGPFVVYKLFDQAGLFWPVELLAIAVLLIAAGLALHFSARRQFALTAGTTCGATVALCAIFVPFLFAIYYHSYQVPIDGLVAYAKQRNANLAVLYFTLPSAIFHYQRQLPLIHDQDEMRQFAEASDNPQWLLINQDVLSLLAWTDRSPRVVVHDGRWWLFAVGRNCKKEGTVEWNGLNIGVYPQLPK